MPTDPDDVDWKDPDVADWLRGLADDDDDPADLPPSILCDSSLGEDAVAAAPFLVDVAVGAAVGWGRADGVEHTVERHGAVATLAAMVSPEFETRGDSARVRAAVAARVADLAALADDANWLVRAHTYLVLGACDGPADVLLRRWDAETDADARAALLIALPARSPEAAGSVVVPAVLGGAPSHRLAGAVGLHRAGLPFPAGAGAAVAAALRAGGKISEELVRDPVREFLVDSADEAFVADLLTDVSRQREPVSPDVGYALDDRVGRSRREPGRVLPVVAPLLHHGDPETRRMAAERMHEGGRAAAAFADDLARLAGVLPERSATRLVSPEVLALSTLVRLNDPRWVEPACRTWKARRALDLSHDFGYLPLGADLLATIGAAFAAADGPRVVAGLAGAVALLAGATRSWDAQRRLLRSLEPTLRAAATVAPVPTSTALLHLGLADERDLRTVAADDDAGTAAAAAVALLRRTGDAGPLAAALRRRNPTVDVAAGILRPVLLTGDGPGEAALTALAELIRPLPMDASVPMRLLAAHVLLRSGDPVEATRLVPVGLTHWLAHEHALRIAVELRDPALEPALRDHLTGPQTPLAARALLALGVGRADVTGPVLHWMAGCDEYDPIVAACTDLLDPMALPRLRDLADSDGRAARGGIHSSVIWRDERHRDAVRAGVAALEARV
ncbi:hypothetical protein [Virgisporangium ochraceum]|uniref:Uncharacterized protein n=1 Tax=Virgisporangium ochraceum TaxID=65505 RepID=A0A8J4EF32_9ACTN|nr:hypothetical protein [Virgisporangium ochraceum]GIJ72268.1 hypothetical protein Voc01_071850 [Virgisporangium ochraceum]